MYLVLKITDESRTDLFPTQPSIANILKIPETTCMSQAYSLITINDDINKKISLMYFERLV